MVVTSKSFAAKGSIPPLHTCEGKDASLALA